MKRFYANYYPSSEVYIMRFISVLVLIAAMLLAPGCSSGGNGSPTVPGAPLSTDELAMYFDNPVNAVPSTENSGWQPAYAGNFIFDGNGGLTITEDRESMGNFNATSFLLNSGNFHYQIVNVSGNLLEVDVTITNPTSIMVFDVRLIFNNIGANKILNPDSYTTLFSTKISPYISFATDDPFRQFPMGGGSDTQRVFFEYNGGPVGFVIAVSLPLYCEEPYEVSNATIVGSLNDEDGGNADLSCVVGDHDWNLDFVVADLRVFTGQIRYMVSNPERPDHFEVNFSNTLLATGGRSYSTYLAAKSLGSSLMCYQIIDIAVEGGVDPPIVTITTPATDPFETSDRFTTIAGTIENFEGTEAILDINGDQQTIAVNGNAFNDVAVLTVGPNVVQVLADGPGGIGSDSVTINCTATSANLWIRLTWDQDDTDVDLYVTEPGPSRFTCWYSEKVSPDTHAQLDLDDVTGYGPEHYYLSVEEGHHLYPGKYEIDVQYYSDHGTGRTCLADVLVYKDDEYYGEWSHIMPISNPGQAGDHNRRTGKSSWWDAVADITM
jgi:hypothetical protein